MIEFVWRLISDEVLVYAFYFYVNCLVITWFSSIIAPDIIDFYRGETKDE